MTYSALARLVLLTVTVPFTTLQSDSRQPVPDTTALSQVEKSVKDVFKDEYAKRAPSDMSALAKKLLQQATTNPGDPPNQYVLLREARDLAAQAGDTSTAMAAAETLSKSFAVDPVDTASVALAASAKVAKTPEALEALANGFIAVADKAIAVDRYEDAAALLAKAENAAKSTQNASLLTRVQTQRKDVGEVQKEFQRVKVAEKTLAEQPDDPNANLMVGRFLCFIRKEWTKGLPLLAKGSDALLQAVARKELANPSTPATQLEVADGWWDAGDKQKDAAVKRKILVRALQWYEKCISGVDGLQAIKIEKRLDEIEKINASGPIVDLLALIDPKKDAQLGNWRKDGATLVTPAVTGQAILQIPYVPPAEYDLKLTAERKDIQALHLGLPVGEVRAEADLDNNSTNGSLNFPETLASKGSVVKYMACYMQKGKLANIVCSVRRNEVTVTIDKKVVLKYEGDMANARPVKTWWPPNSKAMSIGTLGCWVISKMVLVPVTGQGKALR